VDAGTRVGRFMVQDLLGQVWKPLGNTSAYPSILLSSTLIVAGWGYFLYIGVIDPNGGINILWPLFGISNQMLASIALSIATGIIIKKGKIRYAFVTGLPLAWLALVTTVAAWQKVFSTDPKLGFFAGADDLAAKLASGVLPADRIASAPQLIFNQNLDGWLTVFFTLRAVRPDEPREGRVHVDLTGAVLLCVTLVGLVFGLAQSTSSQWRDVDVWGPVLISVVTGVLFLLRERRAHNPLMSLRLLREKRNYLGATVSRFMGGMAEMGLG